MTRSLLTTSLLSTALALTACTKTRPDQAGVVEKPSQTTANIVNGEDVTTNEDLAKTTVQIYTFQIERNLYGKMAITGVSSCTGTLLSDDILLTAAHCTAANPFYMFLYFSTEAPKDLNSFIDSIPTNPLVRRVVGGKVGDNWPLLDDSKESDWGDIALLKFMGGLPEGYQRAALLPDTESLHEQQAITLAGYGLTDGVKKTRSTKLLKVDVSILDPQFSGTEMLIDSGLKGPCHGDSGGPAYVSDSTGQKYVAGITSRADAKTDPQGLCTGDTVYTKVQPYAGWIQKSVQLLQSPSFRPELIPQPQGG